MQDFLDQLDVQDQLGLKDLLVHVENLAHLRSSHFREAQGHLAYLDCQE